MNKSSILAHENMVKKKFQIAKYTNTRRIDHKFEVGDRVLLPQRALGYRVEATQGSCILSIVVLSKYLHRSHLSCSKLSSLI